MRKLKSAKQMERNIKGMANHYRIEIILLLDKYNPLALEDIVEHLDANEKTIGQHTRMLHRAGLVDKKYLGRYVEHSLSPYGKFFASFLKTFQKK